MRDLKLTGVNSHKYTDAVGNAPPIPAAAQNLAIMNGPYVGMKAAITENTPQTTRQLNNDFLLPARPASPPHNKAPRAIPSRVIEPDENKQGQFSYFQN